MFWNKLAPSSLKMRLALTYALLFFLSCCVVFALVVYFIADEKKHIAAEDMRNAANSIRMAYVTGPRFNTMTQILPGARYPRKDLARLRRAVPGAEILFFSSPRLAGADPQERYHTAFLRRGDKFYEVRPRADGSVYSQQIFPGKNPEYVRRHLLLTLATYGKENLTMTIRNSDGTVWLCTRDLLHTFAPDGETVDDHGFYFQDYPLPGGKRLTIGWRPDHRPAQLRSYLLLFLGILVPVAAAGLCTGYLVSQRFLKAVGQLTRAMEQTATGDYAFRIRDTAPGNDREILKLIEVFNAMNERTQSLLEELRMLSGNVAHDLRTPLTRISGTVETLLQDRNLPENVAEACVSVAEESLRMKECVNTMIDISRVTAHPESLQKTTLDLAAELRSFCEIMRPEAERKGLAWRTDLPDTPVPVEADRMKLQRLVSNLTENALKFTDHGQIVFSLRPENHLVTLEIRDTGCGIPEADQPHIFERFYRSDASRNRPGNGLGLALAAAFAKAHGWVLTFDSVPEHGTAFFLQIPLAPAAPPESV